jgi:hypothetical protein
MTTQTTRATPPLPAGWYPDPLDRNLHRYYDGSRWTFLTVDPRLESAPAEIAEPGQDDSGQRIPSNLREDIAAAKAEARTLIGAEKEIRLLEKHLHSEERVVAIAGARGNGIGVLACTNQRLIFLFAGLLNHQFLEVNWNHARQVSYNLTNKQFAVYTGKVTKRSLPALAVTVPHRDDAVRIARAAEAASAAPRLEAS